MSNGRSASTCKVGLGLITLSIVLTIIISLVTAICSLIPNKPAIIDTIDGIILLIAGIASLAGILICLFSGQKNFTFALIMYVAIIITLIVFVALKKTPADWVYSLFYIMIALGHLAIILGLKNLSANRKFNNSMITVCLFLFLTIIVLIFLFYYKIINEKFIWLIKFLDVSESIFFLLAIVTTYKALK